jgi:hypothetical protein
MQRGRRSWVRFRESAVALVLVTNACLGLSIANAASLEKAKVLRTNGLSTEAKRELVELTFDSDSSRTEKAQALLLLGDIAIDESKPDIAKENWSKVVSEFAEEPAAAMASEKLTLLTKLSSSSKVEVRTPAITYMPGTVLVVGPEKYQWSIAQISGALGSYAVPFDGTLTQAMGVAKMDAAVVALVEVGLSVDSAFESGRVVCQLPDGKKVWEEKVMFNLGGGEERIARRFVDGLSEKVKKRRCPV